MTPLTYRQPEPKPEWANDLRWQRSHLWAEIKELDHGVRKLIIEVRVDGELFASSLYVDASDLDEIPEALTVMVERIDDLMLKHGFAPYEIRSH